MICISEKNVKNEVLYFGTIWLFRRLFFFIVTMPCLLFSSKLLHGTSNKTKRNERKKSNKMYRQFQSNIFMYFITSSVSDRYSAIYCAIASQLFLQLEIIFSPEEMSTCEMLFKFMVWNEFVSFFVSSFLVSDIVIRAKLHLSVHISVTKNSDRKTCKQPIEKH